MRTASVICKVLMWITVVVTGFFQVLALIGILERNRIAAERNLPGEVYNPFFFILAMGLMAVALLLFVFLKKRRYIGLCVSLPASLLFIVVGANLAQVFPERAAASGFQGLTMTDAVLRHMSPVLITLFMLLAWLFERQWHKGEAEAAMFAARTEHFDLGDKALFSDDRHRALEDTRPMTQKERRRLKREEERARKKRQ